MAISYEKTKVKKILSSGGDIDNIEVGYVLEKVDQLKFILVQQSMETMVGIYIEIIDRINKAEKVQVYRSY